MQFLIYLFYLDPSHLCQCLIFFIMSLYRQHPHPHPHHPLVRRSALLHARATAETERLRRELQRATAAQTQREIQLQTEFSTAFSELRVQVCARVSIE